jgi:predicted AlkP superfamily pyrophosphatase or phosphodiesterase
MILNFLVALFSSILFLTEALYAEKERIPQPENSQILKNDSPFKLTIFIVIDQARADYFARYAPLFKRGFKELLQNGVIFKNALHEHAITTTSPGHATLVSGRPPREHGIIDNSWFDRGQGKERLAIEDWWYGVSPRQLEASTLADWLLLSDRSARIFSLSGKARAAIFTAGRSGGEALWYQESQGAFASGSYYSVKLPWLKEFNKRHSAKKFLGAIWTPYYDLSKVVKEYNLQQAPFHRHFPHQFGENTLVVTSKDAIKDFTQTPFLDLLTKELALEIISKEKLGLGEGRDMLFISFSALDKVGHKFGSNSPEILDVLLRLDDYLGEIIDSAKAQVGEDHFLLTLSADHGVVAIPELEGKEELREVGEQAACLQRMGLQISTKYQNRQAILHDGYIDWQVIGKDQESRRSFKELLRSAAKECSTIKRVIFADELNQELEDPIKRAYWLSHYPERSPDYYLVRQPGVLTDDGFGTNHGSPYHDDQAVPMIFYLPQPMKGDFLLSQDLNLPVSTTKLAPTIAKLLNIKMPLDLENHALIK